MDNFIDISKWLEKGISRELLVSLFSDWEHIDSDMAVRVLSRLCHNQGIGIRTLDWKSFLPSELTVGNIKFRKKWESLDRSTQNNLLDTILIVKRDATLFTANSDYRESHKNLTIWDYICLYYANEAQQWMFAHFPAPFIKDLSFLAVQNDREFPRFQTIPERDQSQIWLKLAFSVWSLGGIDDLAVFLTEFANGYNHLSQTQILYRCSLRTHIPSKQMDRVLRNLKLSIPQSEQYEFISLLKHQGVRPLLDDALMQGQVDLYELLKAHNHHYVRECCRLHEEYISQKNHINKQQWELWESLHDYDLLDQVCEAMNKLHQQIPNFYQNVEMMLIWYKQQNKQPLTDEQIASWIQGNYICDPHHIMEKLPILD